MKPDLETIIKNEALVNRVEDAYGTLISSRSAWISKERKSVNPNRELIEKWVTEQGNFFNKREQLVSQSLTAEQLETLADSLYAQHKNESI